MFLVLAPHVGIRGAKVRIRHFAHKTTNPLPAVHNGRPIRTSNSPAIPAHHWDPSSTMRRTLSLAAARLSGPQIQPATAPHALVLQPPSYLGPNRTGWPVEGSSQGKPQRGKPVGQLPEAAQLPAHFPHGEVQPPMWGCPFATAARAWRALCRCRRLLHARRGRPTQSQGPVAHQGRDPAPCGPLCPSWDRQGTTQDGVDTDGTWEALLHLPHCFGSSPAVSCKLVFHCGTPQVRLTGGEPTLRPDLTDIIRSIPSLPPNLTINLGGFPQGTFGVRALPRSASHPMGSPSSDGCRSWSLQTLNQPPVYPMRLAVKVSAGLSHLNLSLDTLVEAKYAFLARRKGFPKVASVPPIVVW